VYSPGFAFINLVLSTSTGLPTTHAVKPAIAEDTRWHGTPSYINLLWIIMSFT
jgi:hypothetical protein